LSHQTLHSHLKEFGEAGFINLAGGCCGTTPEHIAAIAKGLAAVPPRVPPVHTPTLRLAGIYLF